MDSIRQNSTMRPPYLSVHIPSGTRMSEPVRTGVAVKMPNCVALSPSVFLIGMPMTPNIIQTMKHTVNANVLTISTEIRFCLCVATMPSLHRWMHQQDREAAADQVFCGRARGAPERS